MESTMGQNAFKIYVLESKGPVINEHSIAVKLEGASISCIQELHDTLKEPLKFPGEYGHSLDALYDVLVDLAWLGRKPVHLIISNFDYFLEAETIEKKIQTLLTLVDAARAWLRLTQQPELFQISIQQSNSIVPMLRTCEVPYEIT